MLGLSRRINCPAGFGKVSLLTNPLENWEPKENSGDCGKRRSGDLQSEFIAGESCRSDGQRALEAKRCGVLVEEEGETEGWLIVLRADNDESGVSIRPAISSMGIRVATFKLKYR